MGDFTRMDPVRDTLMVENTPIDYLDFASPESGLGGKIGLDATNKMGNETHREWGTKIRMDQDVIDKVSDIWDELGLPVTENRSGSDWACLLKHMEYL